MPGSYTLQPHTITANANHTEVTRLGGYSIRATAAAVVINLRQATVSGQILATIGIPTSGASETLPLDGYASAPGGVYVESTGGAFVGVLYDLE